MASHDLDDLVTITSVHDLALDARNPNVGTSRGRAALTHSLTDCGAGRSILTDRTGRVVAGNKVAVAAQQLNLPIRVIRTSGDALVIVQREDLDLTQDPKARQLALADNRVAELGLHWDPDLLHRFAQEHVNLDTLWTPDELEQLVGHGLGQGKTSDDAVVGENFRGFAVSVILSDIAPAKAENKSEWTKTDETIQTRQIAGPKHVKAETTIFLEVSEGSGCDSLPPSHLRSLQLQVARCGGCSARFQAARIPARASSSSRLAEAYAPLPPLLRTWFTWSAVRPSGCHATGILRPCARSC